ncbi:hypothetical protein [Saccharopolyspora sp. NPDC049426]|uniref:hypothetical protein n=1 Tax=Saccharopolyspora sp. NPDC049426 TaxID=3155652 RepID=UPI003436E75F
MRAQPPDLLRRLWWKSPLVLRLVPALALITATGAGVVANLPATGEPPRAQQPPQQVTLLAPTTTPPPPPATTAAPTTSQPPPTTSTSTTTRSSTRTTTSAPPPTPRTPTPTPTTTPSPPSTPRPPEIAEGQPCDEPGDIGRGQNGDRYVCDYDDGTWRWRER